MREGGGTGGARVHKRGMVTELSTLSVGSGQIALYFPLGIFQFSTGPFRFTDNFGADRLVAEMNRFREAYGNAPEFQACDLLLAHAKDPSKRFYAPGK